jgi:hypothetical protein
LEIEERSFVAALLWMTAKSGWCAREESRQSRIVMSRQFLFCKPADLLVERQRSWVADALVRGNGVEILRARKKKARG